MIYIPTLSSKQKKSSADRIIGIKTVKTISKEMNFRSVKT